MAEVKTTKEKYEDIAVMRALAKKIMIRYPEDDFWEKVKSSKVPPEITQFVIDELEKGRRIRSVMLSLGIQTATEIKWRKILASVRQGTRIDSTALFTTWVARNEKLATKLFDALDRLADRDMDKGIYGDKDDQTMKNITMMVETMSRLQLATVKMGKELGVFVDPTQQAQGGQIVINVHTNVPMPTEKEIQNHQEKQVIDVKKSKA